MSHLSKNLHPQAAWLDALAASVFIVRNEVVVYANPAGARLLDAASPVEVVNHPVSRYIHPLDLHRTLIRLNGTQTAGTSNAVAEFRAQTITGRAIVVAMNSSPIEIDGHMGVLCSALDITERAWMEAQLKETDQNFQRIMNTMQDVFYRTDAQGVTRYVCPAVKNVLGYEAEEIIGRPAGSFYPDQKERAALIAEIQAKGFVHDFPGRMRRKDGYIIDISISTHALYDEQGQYAGVEGIWRDITQRKNLERELERLATRDSLTGAANRSLTMLTLQQAYARRGGRRDNALPPYCVLMLDLDRFKSINDTYGHSAGDEALRHIAGLLTQHCRSTDTFGRMGGEEFLFILENTELKTACEVAERIRTAIAAAPVVLPSAHSLVITTSIGVAQYHPEDTTATEVLERADRMLYHAKELGRNQVAVAPLS
jgi:diguanylate cyclase (GGDEF)-like protein/PAS domain S-box-containing protein